MFRSRDNRFASTGETHMAWEVYGAFPSPDYYPRDHKGYAGIGPLPCKRWVKQPGEKYKMRYRPAKYSPPRDRESNDAYNMQLAIKYIEWMQATGRAPQRPNGCGTVTRAIWEHVDIGGAKWYEGHRVRAIKWGHMQDVYTTRKDGRRGAFLYQEFVEEFRVEIPHWNFVHPPIEECGA